MIVSGGCSLARPRSYFIPVDFDIDIDIDIDIDGFPINWTSGIMRHRALTAPERE